MAWSTGQARTRTRAHKRWRAAVLTRDQHQCQLRLPGRCIGTATEADHIVAVHLGGAEHDVTNGQGACQPCHSKKSSQEGAEARRAQGLRSRKPERHPGLI